MGEGFEDQFVQDSLKTFLSAHGPVKLGIMSSSGTSEAVLGEIPVLTHLSQGSERLKLVVTGRRIIVAHLGKRGAGSVTATSLLGGLGRAFEELVKGSKESVTRKKYDELTPSRILASHRDNFAINYEEVVSVDILESPGITAITLISKDNKFEFSTRLKIDALFKLLSQNLHGKIITHRLSG